MNIDNSSNERRHEVDALRVLVLLLLVSFHSMIGFSPFAKMIGIPQNDELLTWITIPTVTYTHLTLPTKRIV